MQLRYVTAQAVSERVFDPYTVVYHRARWYVVGYCHLRQAIRSFRLDRVAQVLLLDDTFVRPSNFDGRRYLLDAIAAIPDVWDVDVTLEMSLDDAWRRVPATLARLEADGEQARLHASIGDLDWRSRLEPWRAASSMT